MIFSFKQSGDQNNFRLPEAIIIMPEPKKPLLEDKEEKLERKLTEVRLKEEEMRTQDLAEKLGLPYINLTGLPIETEALVLIPEEIARQGKIAIIHRAEQELKAAVKNPDDAKTQKILADLKTRGFKTQVFIASDHGLAKAFSRYRDLAKKEVEITGKVEITQELINKFKQKAETLADLKKIITEVPPEEASHVLEAIIAGALQNDSSDLHIEARETNSLLRYRIDGVLHDVVFLSSKTYNLVLSRIKLLAGMILNIRDRAQDGRFTIRLEKVDVEVRVSVIPGPNGENIVMRVLNPKNINLNLKDLGLRDDLYEFLTKEIERPNGMIITTGPTGSGKTTTLYAFLKEVTSPDVKIITLEDPIEYHLIGVTQTQVEAERGYTFAAGLRAILRQDPDIVLVGEIRDKETAEIAVHAALTGHIVFSTLHTNDAAGAIPRFIDMGTNPTILSAALIDIMAQRLLRRVCPECKQQHSPSAEEKAKIKKALSGLPKEVKKPDMAKEFELWKGQGCARCNHTGYKGRIGVYENIAVTAEIEKLITKFPSHAEVLETARKNNFVSMYQDGILKVLQGITTLEELEDVVGTAY
ncbi:MAG: type IV pilus assembly protein PilB [Parcubacteria group bacterium LiPW_39]|nr:MAG: type IV pilus assembly protein PilB [Parcubacteria group bacterium LiPW_39]